MSSDYEYDKALYAKIMNLVHGDDAQAKLGSTNLIVEVGALYINKFPDLGLEENKEALLFLLDLKFEEFKSSLWEAEEVSSQWYLAQENAERRARHTLVELGIVVPEDELIF